MWNKLVEVLHDVSYRRLGIAVFISAILHALLFDGFNFSLPTFKDDIKPLEARIQLNTPTPAPLENESQPEVTKKAKVKVSKSIEPPKVEEASEPQNAIKSPEQPAPENEKVTEEATSQQASENQPPEVAPEQQPAEQQPSEPNTVLNANAYQYVQTDFDVSTEIDGNSQGSATITYNLLNERYQLSWITKGIGIAALLFPELLQNSQGELTKSGLQPNKYTYQFGSDSDKTREVQFDWQQKKITSITSKGSKIEDLPDGTQDLLSFMYQFMYVAPLQQMQISIATGKKLSTYDYSFMGEESISSNIGVLKTMHIVHNGTYGDEKTELWLATDFQYIPVKVRKIEKNGKVVEMVIKRISTSRPIVEQ